MGLIRVNRTATTLGGSVDFQSIAQQANAHLPSIARTLLPDGKKEGSEWVARNPRRSDRRPGSFKINLKTGQWADFAIGETGGDVIALVAYLKGVTQAKAARTVADMIGGVAS